MLAISLAANTAFAKPPAESGSKRGGAGFASGAIIGGAAAGPIGMVVGAAVGAMMGERSHKKSEAMARRNAEAALLASELELLNNSLADIETKAGAVGSTVQFRTGETGGSRQRSRAHRQARRAGCRTSRTCACASRASRIRAATMRST